MDKAHRSKKRNSRKWKKNFEEQKRLYRQMKTEASDILESSNFRSTKQYIQHGSMTVHGHCMNVAKYSLSFSQRLHIKCNQRELIRGALLHDYFLYDWHDAEHIGIQNLHGFYHPGKALENAEKEYELTARERDIIKKHMWPLTIVPPLCKEAWIVTTVDKWCSLMETFYLHKGHGRVKLNPQKQEATVTMVAPLEESEG